MEISLAPAGIWKSCPSTGCSPKWDAVKAAKAMGQPMAMETTTPRMAVSELTRLFPFRNRMISRKATNGGIGTSHARLRKPSME